MTEIPRNTLEPIPDDLETLLTPAQMTTLQKVESFGWKLFFVRRPLFQNVVAVIKCPDGENCTTAILEEDGTLNKNHDLVIRP